MVDALSSNFTSTLYKNIHFMKKHNWNLEEILNIPPLELSIFKNMLVQEIKEINQRRR
jgi:hypothetical protein